jgi:hypothetical protein
MADFAEESIEIRYFTDLWGVFQYEMSPLLPTNAIINAVAVRAFIGNVKTNADLSGETEITSDFVDPSYAPVITDDTVINVKFQYPGVTYRDEKVTIIFEVTTNASAKHPFYFKYFKIR